MSLVVKVPSQLRLLTQGAPEVAATGDSVEEVLRDVEGRHPGFTERILDDAGAVRRFVNIYVDDEDIRFLDGIETPVTTSSRISIIPSVAGG